MLFVLISAQLLLVVSICVNAIPMSTRYIPLPDHFVAEESHPFETAVPAPKAAPPMEVSDDDQYDQTTPVAVMAVPAYDYRGFGDLTASATDLQAEATYGGHGGHDHGGWLDMGAYTSGKGAFGW